VLYSPVPAGNWDQELPGQMLSSIGEHGFWYYYRYSGDKETIAHAYPAVKRYLALWELGDDGLLIHRAGGWDWGDWGENIDRPVMDNALLYQALGAAIEMAQLTGNNADIPGYQAMRSSIAENYNRRLWTGSEYRSPGYTGKTDDRGHGLAVLYGLAQPDQWPAIKRVFTNSFEASPYLEKYLLESLLVMGDTDAALVRMKARYRPMVESPLTTLWEGWGDNPSGGSYNHGWSGGPLTLLMQYVAGIAPTAPGFATYQVKPQLGSLRQVKVIVPTVKGDIQANIRRQDARFTLNLNSPPGAKATVWLPTGDVVKIDGKPAASVRGAIYQGRADGHEIYEVGPGQWTFSAH
jgi:glycogen debranching enzyme